MGFVDGEDINVGCVLKKNPYKRKIKNWLCPGKNPLLLKNKKKSGARKKKYPPD